MRRLAAIVAVDVAGFSAMMAADEDGTLATLKAHRAATDPITLNHGGRVVKTTGDGMLIEVPSAVEAVRAAIEAQQMMARRNAELPPERRMRYRMGVNLGDVIVDDDDDVYGDGVNVAARLEPLAEPGGICVSDTVRRHVEAQLDDVEFRDLGEHELKNIPQPVRVWAVGPFREAPDQSAEAGRRPFSPQTTVAVLPFENMSADPDQEFVADGITEDLITALSHDHDLQVVARNSVFAFKGRPTDVRSVGRQLDARYVVEGSVRRVANRVRVTAQLIEADSGRHVWAERYDRQLDDVFVLQDEIVDAVRTRVAPTVRSIEERRSAAARLDHLDAWELLHRARWHARRNNLEDLRTGIELAERALALSSGVAAAHLELTYHWTAVALQGWHVEGRDGFRELRHHAEQAYRLAPDDAFALAAVSHARSYVGDTGDCVHLARRAVDLNPHTATTWVTLAHTLYFDGRHEESVAAATEGWRLGAHEGWRWHIASTLAFAHYLRGAYEPAARWGAEALTLHDYLQARAVTAAALAQLGRPDDAGKHLDVILGLRRGLTVAVYRRRFNWRESADVDHFMEGLAKAGLPA